jgi:hypothetical protein
VAWDRPPRPGGGESDSSNLTLCDGLTGALCVSSCPGRLDPVEPTAAGTGQQ